MKIAILYNKFFDHNGKELIIGGVETYLQNFSQLCKEIGFKPVIYQWAEKDFLKQNNGIEVRGIRLLNYSRRTTRNHKLFEYVCSEIDLKKDVLVFGADHVSVSTRNKKHISIQHGVSWDLPTKYMSSRYFVKYELFARILKKKATYKYKKYFENCLNTVCVDYNFLNWYRTTISEELVGKKIWIVPNFSLIASEQRVNSRNFKQKKINIIFARRFVEIRGTRLFASVLEKLLPRYPNIHCTFSGEGPDEEWLRSKFSGEKRVTFKKYKFDESLDMHLQHDIAVVPSLASEGTSLSVAEAMATGCPVVATATGGITNMIINGYNGILTMPTFESLTDGIVILLDHPELRLSIGNRAYDTAKNAFSLDRWKDSWEKILLEVIKE
jgi:glycosyltransferase involved in cell wall biosynthesis